MVTILQCPVPGAEFFINDRAQAGLIQTEAMLALQLPVEFAGCGGGSLQALLSRTGLFSQ